MAINHGNQRISPDLPGAAAALEAARVPLPSVPPRLPRKAVGLAKPRAPVRRLSSSPDRYCLWSLSSAASEAAFRLFCPTYFLMTVSSSGAAIAIRLVAEEFLMSLMPASAVASPPALSPKSAGSSVEVPSWMSERIPLPPKSNSPPTLSRTAVFSSGRLSSAMSWVRPSPDCAF
ncbi:hypothetical protein D3C78_1315930 [compost metagenome]